MKYSYQEIRKLCLKPDEAVKPIYARYVTHSVSTWLIWLFQDLSVITPNMLTLISLVFALLAIPFFVAMTPNSVLAGTFLIETYYVFDAIDGQWARLKNAKSLTGTFFDCLINFSVQPPLLFAIGWGLFQIDQNPFFLLLGFTSGFSMIWVVLMWHLRGSVLFGAKGAQTVQNLSKFQTSDTTTKKNLNFALNIFSWAHKSLVFPWFMHILSAICLICFFLQDYGFQQFVFSLFLIYYGVIGPLVAIILTTHWIVTKAIDHETV